MLRPIVAKMARLAERLHMKFIRASLFTVASVIPKMGDSEPYGSKANPEAGKYKLTLSVSGLASSPMIKSTLPFTFAPIGRAFLPDPERKSRPVFRVLASINRHHSAMSFSSCHFHFGVYM